MQPMDTDVPKVYIVFVSQSVTNPQALFQAHSVTPKVAGTEGSVVSLARATGFLSSAEGLSDDNSRFQERAWTDCSHKITERENLQGHHRD